MKAIDDIITTLENEIFLIEREERMGVKDDRKESILNFMKVLKNGDIDELKKQIEEISMNKKLEEFLDNIVGKYIKFDYEDSTYFMFVKERKGNIIKGNTLVLSMDDLNDTTYIDDNWFSFQEDELKTVEVISKEVFFECIKAHISFLFERGGKND